MHGGSNIQRHRYNASTGWHDDKQTQAALRSHRVRRVLHQRDAPHRPDRPVVATTTATTAAVAVAVVIDPRISIGGGSVDPVAVQLRAAVGNCRRGAVGR
jgi:hypothetical protein